MKKLWLGFLVCLMVCAVFGAQAGLASNAQDWPTRNALTLPDNLEIVGEEAFCNIGAAQYVYVPDGAKRIEARAFAENDIREIFLPESIEYIAPDAFEGCDNYVCIVIENGAAEAVCSANGLRYAHSSELEVEYEYTVMEDGTVRIDSYIGESLSAIIPERIAGHRVTAIGNDPFIGCRDIQSVYVPDSVTTFGTNVFDRCAALTKVHLPQSLSVIPEYTFSGCNQLADIDIPDTVTEIGRMAFWYCNSLEKIDIPEGVQVLGEYCFRHCINLKDVRLPSSLVRISQYAFSECKELVKLDIPESLQVLEDGVFWDCIKLEQMVLPKHFTELPGGLFDGCVSLKSFELPEGITKIPHSLFRGCKNLEPFAIPDTVTEIGSYAFEGCERFTEFALSDKIVSIGAGAFIGTNITSLDIPDGIKEVDAAIAQDCVRLTSVHLPDSVTKIDARAFSGCASLTQINIPANVEEIDANAFERTAIKSFTLPKKVIQVADGLFKGCKQLESVTLHSNVVTIRHSSFAGCTALTYMQIPDRIEEISKFAFTGCNDIMFICNVGTQAAYALGECGYPVTDPDYRAYRMYQAREGSVDYLFVVDYIGTAAQVKIPNKMGNLPIIGVMPFAFSGKTVVTRIEMQSNMTAIGEGAFTDCPNLQRVYIPNSVTYIEDGIVDGSPNVTIYVKSSSTALTYCKQNKIPYKTY